MSADKLHVTAVTIKDVLGAREFSMEPGQINVLAGSNGTGKSTALEAIKSAIGGGSLAKLERIADGPDDEVSPEVVLLIEGDTPNQHYRVEKSGKAVRVRKRVGDTAGLEDVVQPQRWLTGLFDASMANPIEFLRAPDRDRILLLLEALPVRFDRNKLWFDLGLNKRDFQAVPEGIHPISELAMIREAIFRERTGVNRDAKAKAASAEQTRRAVPAVIPEGLEDRINDLDETTRAKESDLQARSAEMIKSHELKVAEIKSTHEAWAAERRVELEREIAEARDKANESIDAAIEEKDRFLTSLGSERGEIEKDREQLAGLREQFKATVKAKTLYDQAEQFDTEAAELQAKSEQLTGAIEHLDAFRRSLLESLPIPGLEVDDKTLRIDGIPFDQVNTARRIQIAVQIACLRAKRNALPVVWVDGAEALDSENFEHLCEALKAEGVQAFIGRVVDAPLTVEVQ